MDTGISLEKQQFTPSGLKIKKKSIIALFLMFFLGNFKNIVKNICLFFSCYVILFLHARKEKLKGKNMTEKDLRDAGIICERFSDSEFGLLVLKYDGIYLEGKNLLKFKTLEAKVKPMYSLEEFQKNPDKEKEFLKTCLAISDKKFQNAYLAAKCDNLEALLMIHNMVVEKGIVAPEKKENIRQARKLAEEDFRLQKYSKEYKFCKETLETLLPLKIDEIVFEGFCRRSCSSKEILKRNLDNQFAVVMSNFLNCQDKLFTKFIDCYVKEDSRLRAFQAQEAKLNA